MLEQSPFCDQCREVKTRRAADYQLASEEVTLQGPELGDPDYWPDAASRWPALCQQHYLELPADVRLDYRPVRDEFSPIL